MKLIGRIEINKAMYHALASHEHLEEIAGELGLGFPPGYRLICVTTRLDGDQFEIALINDYTAEVAYYNQVTIVHYKGNPPIFRGIQK